jgi:hypothetical protein
MVGGRTITNSYEGTAPIPWQITALSEKNCKLAYESALGYTIDSLATGDGMVSLV